MREEVSAWGNILRCLLAVPSLLALPPTSAVAQEAIALPPYRATQHVSGTIRAWGSPQMGDLMKRYEAGFRRVQPDLRFEDDLKSTVTAVAGVYTGRADIGLLGREIWPSEVLAFESIEGSAPSVIEVATGSYDVPKATYALMIFVPRANPIPSLSTAQLARIFGAGSTLPPIRTWGELGLKGAWARRPIHLYGYPATNDKSLIFRELVFLHGERWNAKLRERNNIEGAAPVDAGELIVQAVAGDPDAIGISNIHYATAAVRALPISTTDAGKAIPPSRATAASREYPLTRSVYMVVAPHPGAAAVEFLRFVLSREGAEAVGEEGNYLPLPAPIARKELESLHAP